MKQFLTYSPRWIRSNWFQKLERITSDVDTYLTIFFVVIIAILTMLNK